VAIDRDVAHASIVTDAGSFTLDERRHSRALTKPPECRGVGLC
jgi:hypothetical protein